MVVVLVVLNLASLGYIAWKAYHQKSKKSDMPVPQTELSEVLKNELGLSARQTDSLKIIRADFFDKEKILSENTRLKRDSMNLFMFSENSNDSLLVKLATEVSSNEYKMELLRIEQAAQLRNIFTDLQLKKLNGVIKEIRDYLKPATDKK